MNKSLIPLLGFLGLAVAAALGWWLLNPSPALERLEPEQGSPGTPAVLYGRNFGELSQDSLLSVGQVAVARSDIVSWTNSEIRFFIPEEARSGPVRLATGGGETAGLFWVNETELPVPLSGGGETGTLLETIEPSTAQISDLITLHGKGFGGGIGEVLFSWGPLAPGTLEGGLDPWVRAASDEIEAWSDTEIKVRVPTGVTSGNVIAVGPRGPSNGGFLEIDSRNGTQSFMTRRRLVLNRKADFQVKAVSNPSLIRVWVPLGILDLTQRSLQIIRQPGPPSVFSTLGVPAWDLAVQGAISTQWEWEYILPVFSIQSSIRGELIPELTPFPAVQKYLVSDSEIPWNTERFRNISLNVGGWPGPGRTPWDRTRGLYNWIATEFRWNDPEAVDLETALRLSRGTVEQGCRLLIGLLRASRIPARLVSGYLVAGTEKLVPHFWVEFYLSGIGWLSADPYLGSGNSPPEFFLPPEPRNFYLGNLDNRRLTLGKAGLILQEPLEFSSRASGRIPQALHPIHEELRGSLEQYEVLWHSLNLTGIY